MTSPGAGPGRWLAWLPGLVALASRGSALGCGFAMDDAYNIVDNPEIRSLPAALGAAGHALSAQGDGWTAGLNAAYWRPVATFSWAVDYALWGLQPTAFHAGNLLLHAATALVLGATIRALQVHAVPAALVACWWAAHAVHSETVTLVTYRTELLAGLCMVAAMHQAASRDDGGRPWLLAALFGLGLGAKESAASLPLLWAAVAWTRRLQREVAGGVPSTRAAWLRARAPAVLAMVGVAGAWWLVRAQLAQATSLPFFGALSPGRTLLSSVAVAGKEASWLLWPWPLAPFWDQTMLPPVLSWAQAELWAGIAWLVVLVLGLSAWPRQPLLGLGAALWIGAKLPTSQLIPLPVGAAERFAYVASIGAACALAWALQRAWVEQPGTEQTADAARRRRAVWALGAWIATLGALSATRALDFRDDDTLTAATVRDHPDGFNGWFLLGKRALARGDAFGAARALDRAATILPGFLPNERLRAEAWRAAGDPARAATIEADLAPAEAEDPGR